jgi:NAD(P)-dependent dehydrogenase (short-subunit alcohol dehydrogenase family)
LGVRINGVAPGPIETAMLNRFTGSPERRAGLVGVFRSNARAKPDEIANAIVFLASSKSSFTTGQVLFGDRGKSAT